MTSKRTRACGARTWGTDGSVVFPRGDPPAGGGTPLPWGTHSFGGPPHWGTTSREGTTPVGGPLPVEDHFPWRTTSVEDHSVEDHSVGGTTSREGTTPWGDHSVGG